MTLQRAALTPRMRPFTTTVFAEMSALAARTGAINLGQGFPDTDGPSSLLEDAVAAIRGGANQYPPGPGVRELREAVAAHQERFYGLRTDPDDVLVTVGATEAITAAVLALTEPGDEVVTFEPYYDGYAAAVALAGAARRTVVLRSPGFAVDEAALRAAFTPRTRLVLLNSPHNPTGKVFTRAELELVARLAAEHDAVVISDEVYEHMTYGVPHVPIATLPGMAERTLTISSAGKTFSVTGWKVGWVHGPTELVAAVRAVKQFLTFVGSGPFQPAVARALALPDEYFDGLRAGLERKRDLLMTGLDAAGFAVNRPDGTYFVTADAAPLGYTDAMALCWDLPELAGVVGVPVGVFHDDPEAAPSLVRFAFCKQDAVLGEAVDRLAALGARLAG
ncbi:pyridoxal phosphate-dependent aminotransferase [Trujillonella endophytica]|uniref:N-succinyldiaminopimelate aminotransferase n=1 Tax=Trujillonella endophytica TaxID=673521 RepID=A0A1H8WNP7_9ACTN|nr:pyridoxal phosphate-dependent aminotransferase [Trujillella endophytica]SEP29281.1 N-succinyldiaminopimelate aminotransferase [Trujillella endophytica]